ncbi:hypothetical protein [Paraglaciecola sp. L3A3]|uniref:hypothetical protein n=1 Tax=Paraglaciecola sp. L3A3 TaxID=2686358 RepID=UPI00131DCC14|nr:hypothetical protein [Paraglaciecola sp. L3A3]
MILHVGFILFSVFIGFTIGASNSPVVGHFLTAIFGLAGAIVGTEYLSNDGEKFTLSKSSVGACLIFTSVSLFLGLISGDFYRNSGKKIAISVPWEGQIKPSTTKEALDWLAVRTSLISLGYSDSDISNVYKIRVKEIERLNAIIEKEKSSGVEDYERTKLYDYSSPFHSMLPKAKAANVGTRGPASIN